MDGLPERRSLVRELRPGSALPHGPGPIRFSLDGVTERERPAVYREFFGRSVCRFDIEPLPDVPFDADVTLHSLPGLQLFSGRVHGSRNGRTPGLLADGTDHVALVVNLGGPYLATQGGEEIVLGDGEATLVSEAEPFGLTHRPPGGLLVLRIPRVRLASLVRGLEDRVLMRIPHTVSALKLLTGYVKIAWDAETIEGRALQHVVVTHIHDLVAIAVGATRDAAEMAESRGLRAARLHVIKEEIGRELGEPDLSVGALAFRHGCTPRFIQRLFEDQGTTFTEYVLEERLARAYRTLVDPRRAGEKISTIALDAGFSDVSYFNRAFRRRYGETPSGVRAESRPYG